MKIKGILVSLFVLFGFTVGLIGLSDVTADKKHKYAWKMGTIVPDGVEYTSLMNNEVIPNMEKVTNGEVSMVFYYGGVMGDEEDYLSKMRIGQLHGCILSVGGCLMACPEMGVLQLPFLFEGLDEVVYIRKKLRKRFSEVNAKNGYKMLFWGDQDFDQIYSTKYKMTSLEDFKKCKFLNHAGVMEYEILKAAGASPIPIRVSVVASAMRSGVCNACIAPSVWWLGAQLYTVTKYVNPYPFRYSPATIVVANKVWDNLPEVHRVAIDKVFMETEPRLNKLVTKGNQKAYRAMVQYGVKEIKMTPEEVVALREKTAHLYDKLVGKVYSRDLLNQIQAHLKRYRAKKGKV